MSTAITVVCPYCNNQMRASSEHIGRQGRCPSCKALVLIAAPPGDESISSAPSATGGGVPAAPPRMVSTDVPAWIAGLVGAAATLILYLVLFLPLRHTSFGGMFVSRGVIPYLTILLSCWGLAILALKYYSVKKQMSYAGLELELIPLEIGLQITGANVDQFLGHLSQLPGDQRYSILGRRLHGALEHFKSRNSVPEVQSYLTTQAEIDASMVDSGYTLLKAFIWAVPILGFIGTVIGLSTAVLGLQQVSGAENVAEHLRTAMGSVTSGLSTAFDTTLIALVMAVIMLFPMETLRKSEYKMLDRIEQFTNESLLRRMVDDARGGDEQLPAIVRDTLQAAFQQHERWLAQWQAQVGRLGQAVGAEFESAAFRVQERLAHETQARIDQLQGLTGAIEQLLAHTGQSTLSWQGSEERLVQSSQVFLLAAERLEHSLAATAERLRQVVEQVPGAIDPTGELTREVRELRQSMGSRPSVFAPDAATAQTASVDGHAPSFFDRWRRRRTS